MGVQRLQNAQRSVFIAVGGLIEGCSSENVLDITAFFEENF